MKLSNFEEVILLTKQLERVNDALSDSQDYFLLEDPRDSEGYHGNITQYDDGSGYTINLTGCYVFNELVESVIELLFNKKDSILAKLKELGVDVES